MCKEFFQINYKIVFFSINLFAQQNQKYDRNVNIDDLEFIDSNIRVKLCIVSIKSRLASHGFKV